jgi:hypothetical protein
LAQAQGHGAKGTAQVITLAMGLAIPSSKQTDHIKQKVITWYRALNHIFEYVSYLGVKFKRSWCLKGLRENCVVYWWFGIVSHNKPLT